MNSNKSPQVDWVNLPSDVRDVGLWDALHDGTLMSVCSDLLNRTVTLQFDVDYVRDFNRLPEGILFAVVLSGVQSVRATQSEPWPGEFSVPRGASRAEESRLIAEYHSKWREESQSWKEFEQSSGEDMEVSDASIVFGHANSVALRLAVMMSSRNSFSEAFIRAEGVTFAVGGDEVTMERFLSLGAAYWEAFANRSL